jgi:pantetheine-phosphate adenylyltransferase
MYAGSFDPVTNGHAWVIEKMSAQFDISYVVIMENTDKTKDRFSIAKREVMLRAIAEKYMNVEVRHFKGMYQSDLAETLGVKYLIRGVRNGTDFGYETDMRYINSTINPEVETIYLTPPKDLLQISSSSVMGLVGFIGWEEEVRKLVPSISFSLIVEKQRDTDNNELFTRWLNLCRAYNFDGSNIGKILFDAYGEQHRYYHTLQHIKNCLRELDNCRSQIYDPEAVEFAIWFHDAVYQIGGRTNEGQSADIAKLHLLPYLASDKVRYICTLIMHTMHEGHPVDNDAKILTDIDLAGFGYSERISRIFESLIRLEYKEFTNDSYYRGRLELLNKFSRKQRGNFYSSDHFLTLYEDMAQKNINREISEITNIIEMWG